jgi:4-amino-4-deoxy-L-arabinose transferase-like glycosyltransferase
VALLVLLGPLDVGIWSDYELPVFDRTRAELGVALSGLSRGPWLPDALRSWSHRVVGGEFGLRLPHAVAAAALVALAGAWARRRGATVAASYLAAAFALSFPGLVHAGTTALGNPIAELLGVTAVLLGTAAAARRGLPAVVLAAGAALSVAAAVASAGLLLGGVIPLGVIAATQTDRRLRAVLWAATAAAAFVVLWLSVHQGDGYIPLLGASKDLELVDKPHLRRFTAGLQEAGYQLFPWTPVVAIGAFAVRRDRLPSVWLAIAVTLTAAWSIVYGPVAFPIAVPAALCAAAAIDRLDDPAHGGAWRRVVLLGSALGILVLAKDASLTPSEIAAPLSHFVGEHTFPAEGSLAAARLERIAKVALLALLVVAALTMPAHGRIGRLVARALPRRARPALLAITVGAAAAFGALLQTRTLLPELSRQLSAKQPLSRWAQWVADGQLPDELGDYRVRDEGMDVYGPPERVDLRSRREAGQWLSDPQPRVMIARQRDVAPLYQQLRGEGRPMYVLDASHQSLRLLSNVLPEGAQDFNEIPSVLLSQPPVLAHQTYIKFGNYVEIIGWEITDPVIRGREVTVRVALRAVRPLPSGSKLYARLLKGRTSRLNGEPTALTNDIYPANLWREGDYILHEVTFTAPWLEIQWGPHELLFGIRRTERNNVEITVPEGKSGDFGVSVRGKKRYFAAVGEVEVW